MLGTVGYLAPEQARGEPTVDARADVFALGCVIYRCVTGKRPFVGEDDLSVLLKIIVEEPPRLRDVRPGVPASLDALGGAHARQGARGMRPADGAAVVAAIAALAADAPITVRTRQPELTSSERRVMGLVLMRDPLDEVAVAPRSQNLREGEIAGLLHGTVERHRGQLELLADGSSLAVFTSDGEATDLAVRAARCALSIRSLCPTAPVVVVSGRAELAGQHARRASSSIAPSRCSRPAAPRAGPGAELYAAALVRLARGLHPPRRRHGGAARARLRRRPAAGSRASASRWRRRGRCSASPPPASAATARSDGARGRLRRAPSRSPRPACVLVTAAAGMGKSRLGSELLRRLRQREAPPRSGSAAAIP